MEGGVGVVARGSRAKVPGWWRWGAIGCGVVVLALLGALAMGAFSTQRMLVWGVSRLADRVVEAVPAGTPAVVREALRRRVDCVVRAARERRVDERRLGEFARACTEALADKVVSAQEEERIAAIAEEICRDSGESRPQ